MPPSEDAPPLWFARGGGIGKMGPFTSQHEASQALIGLDGMPIEGAFVWPEDDECVKLSVTSTTGSERTDAVAFSSPTNPVDPGLPRAEPEGL